MFMLDRSTVMHQALNELKSILLLVTDQCYIVKVSFLVFSSPFGRSQWLNCEMYCLAMKSIHPRYHISHPFCLICRLRRCRRFASLIIIISIIWCNLKMFLITLPFALPWAYERGDFLHAIAIVCRLLGNFPSDVIRYWQDYHPSTSTNALSRIVRSLIAQ